MIETILSVSVMISAILFILLWRSVGDNERLAAECNFLRRIAKDLYEACQNLADRNGELLDERYDEGEWWKDT